MKKALLIIACTGMFTACDNPVSKKINETREQVSNGSKALEEMNTMQTDIEELQQVTPLTNEELKAWLPEEINGMKRIAYKTGQMSYMKIAHVEATYANEDKSKTFKISVLDGAGEAGAAATAGFRMLFSQDFEEEDEYRSKKTAQRDGIKVIQEYKKKNNNSKFEFLAENRFFIQANGTNMDLEETWDAVEELEIENLE